MQTPIKNIKDQNQQTYQSQVSYLEHQISMRDQAIQKAETIINLYRSENQRLKLENQQLKNTIKQSQWIKQEKELQTQHQECQQQIKDLLEQKVELLKIIKLHQEQIRFLSSSRKYIKTQVSYHHHKLKLSKDSSQDSVEQIQLKKVQKLLQKKLQLKDQQVLHLLKRVHDLQSKCRKTERSKILQQGNERTSEGMRKVKNVLSFGLNKSHYSYFY